MRGSDAYIKRVGSNLSARFRRGSVALPRMPHASCEQKVRVQLTARRLAQIGRNLLGDCAVNDGLLIELPIQCVWFRSSLLDRYERGYAGPEPVRLADCYAAGVRKKVAWQCAHSGSANEICLTIEAASCGFRREKWR